MARASQRDAAVGHDRVPTIWGVASAFAALVAAATMVAGCVALSTPAAPSGSSPVAAVPTASLPSVAPTALAPSPSPSASPVAPSVSPWPTAVAGSPTAGPEFAHVDPELERYVPAKIGAVELDRISLAGADIPPGGDMCILLCGNEPRDFAQALGIRLDRVTVAVSFGDRGGIGGVAFRAKGVATDRLAAAGSAIKGGVVGGGESFPMRVAERDVWFLYRLNRGQYLIPIGDVLVFLYGEAPMTAPGQISPAGTVPPDVVALIQDLPR